MKWTDLRLRIRALILRERVESELQEEIDFHLEMQTRKNRSRGIEAGDARRQALTKFGSVQRAAEECREERRLNLIDSTIQDVRYANRQFRRSPLFTIVAILSLALGIGANTALFTVFDALYLRKVPVNQPDDLVSFQWKAFGESNSLVPRRVSGTILTTSDSDTGVEYTVSASFPSTTFEEFRKPGTPSEVFAFAPFQASADIRGWPYDVSAQLISRNYFSTLGVSTIAGRLLGAADDDAAAEPAVVISHFAWQKFFGGDRSAVGEKITLNGLAATIVGITPPGFYLAGGTLPAFSISMAFAPQISQGAFGESGLWWLRLMARKQSEATISQVESSLQGLFQASMLRETAISASVPEEYVPRLEALPGNRGFVDIMGSGRQESFLITVAAVFALLLLIVCLNLANLLTARAVAREYEIGMRLAMGAGRRRLVRQLLTESIILALVGGGVGVVLAYWGKDLLTAYIGEQIVLNVNLRVLAFTTGVAAVAGILFGLAPALRATRSSLNHAVKRNVRNTAPSRVLLNKSLIVIQVAMSVALLIGAGLLVRTLGNWRSLDMGFDADRLLIFDVPPVDQAKEEAGLYGRVAEHIKAVPGIMSVTAAGCFPPSSCGNQIRVADGIGESRSAQVRRLMVEPDFFETIGISFLAGRNVDRRDVPGSPPVAVIDEALAHSLFPGSNPIGRRFASGRAPDLRAFEVVGVVENIVLDIGRSEIRPNYYTPSSQSPDVSGGSFIIRTAVDPQIAIPEIRRAVADVDAGLPLFGVTTFKQFIDRDLTRHRQMSATWILFGGTALLLTAIGLYGLMSYTVSRRVNEIGIRMALGATTFHILVLVTRQMLGLVLIGLIAGFGLSLALNQVLWSFVFGVRLFDIGTLLWVSLAVSVVTGLAGYMPARKAWRVDPMTALRCE